MTRVSMLTPDQMDPELRALVRADDRSSFDVGLNRIFAHRPQAAIGLAAFSSALRRDALLPPRLLELVRLRIAFFNQCRSCMAMRRPEAYQDGLTEDLVCSLEKPEEAEDLTAAEKLAVRYAELMATDHLAIGEAFYENLREHFSDAEIVELGLNCALFVGIGRLSATWDMIDELPERFQQSGEVTPWGGDQVAVADY